MPPQPSQSLPGLRGPALPEEWLEKLDVLEYKMQELKRDLHGAKEQCLSALIAKFTAELSSARSAFANEAILASYLKNDKVTGWNNIVKECKMVQFGERQFILV